MNNLNLGSIQIPISAATKTFASYNKIYYNDFIWKIKDVIFVARLSQYQNFIREVKKVGVNLVGLVRIVLRKNLKNFIIRHLKIIQNQLDYGNRNGKNGIEKNKGMQVANIVSKFVSPLLKDMGENVNVVVKKLLNFFQLTILKTMEKNIVVKQMGMYIQNFLKEISQKVIKFYVTIVI